MEIVTDTTNEIMVEPIHDEPCSERSCWLHLLTITNFKSYRGQHTIGPFQRLSSIIGPNGAGKSNLLDAIAFVLGIENKHIRSISLPSLIYTPYTTEEDKPTMASVALIMAKQEKGTLHYDTFMRCLTLHDSGACTSTFSFNNKIVKTCEYQDSLRTYNIIMKAKNFIAFQGDVIAVAQKTPLELSLLFEQISEAYVLRCKVEQFDTELKSLTNELKHLHLERQRCEVQRDAYKKQKEELDEYKILNFQATLIKSKIVTFKLYINELDYHRLCEKLEEDTTRKLSLENEFILLSQDIRNKDAELLNSIGEHDQLVEEEKKRVTEESDYNQKLQNVCDLINFLTTQEEKLHEQNKELASLQEITLSRLQKLQESCEENAKELHDLDTDYFKAKGIYDSTFPLHVKSQFENITLKSSNTVATTRLSLQVIKTKYQCLLQEITQVERNIQTVRHQSEELLTLEKDIQLQLTKISKELQNISQLHTTMRQTCETKINELKIIDTQRQNSREEIDALEYQIDMCQSSVLGQNKQFNPYHTIRTIVEALEKNLHTKETNIVGCLYELYRPTTQQYEVSCHAALSRRNTCIVVDTFEMAQKCVACLKSMNLGVAEFASMDIFKNKMISDHRLRQIVQKIKKDSRFQHIVPCLDTLDFPAQYSNLFHCLLQDTLVVDTLEHATDLIFGEEFEDIRDAYRFNAVTLNGEIISKNGNIIINSQWEHFQPSSNIFTHSRHSASADVLKQAKERLQYLYGQYNAHNISQLENEISELKCEKLPQLLVKQQKIQHEYNALQIKKNELQQKREHIDTLVDQYEKKLTQLQTYDLCNCVQELEQTEKQEKDQSWNQEYIMTEQGQKTYAELSHIDTQWKNFQVDYLDKKNKLQSLRIQLESELEHVSFNQASQLEQINTCFLALQDIQKRLSVAKTDKIQLISCGNEKQTSLKETLKKRLQELETCIKNTKEDMRQKRSLSSQLRDHIFQLTRDIQNNISSLDNVGSMSKSLLTSAFIERIPLPVTSEDLPMIAEAIHLNNCEGISYTTYVEMHQPKNVTTLPTLLPKESDARRTLCHPLSVFYPLKESHVYPCFNFSLLLTENQLENAESSDSVSIQRIEREFEEELLSLKQQLQVNNLNLKAPTQLQDAQKIVQDIFNQIETVKQRKLQLEKDYKLVRRERMKRFTHCFDYTQHAVQKYYKRLTGGKEGTMAGGSAFLEMDGDSLSLSTASLASQQPLVQPSIYYNVIPPSKRISSLKDLSGGEKTMAALALLFALYSYRPAPFFILDEIDADLDAINLNFLSNFIQEEKIQILIISHSDRIFSRTQQLIGVYIDTKNESSAVASLDLTVYPKHPILF